MTPALSFRDPAGQLLRANGRVLRVVGRQFAPEMQAFLSSEAHASLVDAGKLVSSTLRTSSELADIVELADVIPQWPHATLLEHEVVPLPSYAAEWSAATLHAAAELTLDLSEALLDEGWGLKDATPDNVLFRGSHPVFVDLLSIERRDPLDPTWLPYAQFVRTFLLPLLLEQRLGIPSKQIFLAQRDGIEPEVVYRILSPWRRLQRPFLTLVSIPHWLGSRAATSQSLYQPRRAASTDQARFVLRHLFRSLRRHLAACRPASDRTSTWSGYADAHSYEASAFSAKEAMVRDVLSTRCPRSVLDIGCNTGHFSRLAASAGARTVALDGDAVVVGRVFDRARAEGADILPLVLDIARPTPALGWRNREFPSFLDRVGGGFDLVLMLAVVHHLLITDRIPLREIVDLCARLSRGWLLIEYVAPADPMFHQLVRGRSELFAWLTPQSFEDAWSVQFRKIEARHLSPTRTLYLLEKR